MTTGSFRKNIEDIHIPILTEWKDSGIVFTDGAVLDSNTPPSILFSVESAREKFGANAVYFRYYSDRQTFLPQLYLFDFTNTVITEESRKEIHKRMWNGSQVPAYMIVEKTAITICNARLNPSNANALTEILRLSAEAFSSFQSQDLANGVFWDTLQHEKRYDFDQSATKDLIRGLKKVFEGFLSDSGLGRHVALRLLMQCILIKYLEDREESNRSGYFASHYFKENFGCDDFCSTIRGGKLLDLLDLLAVDFNGKIFEWNSETQSEERTAIRQTQVRELARYLDANIEDNQYLLWRKYSFSCLPVEVISSVYEELLTDSKDIVYTPEMIVATLVDECMPIEKPQENFKLIDVSCGSGIFLVKVAAFNSWTSLLIVRMGHNVKHVPVPVFPELPW